MGISDYLDIRKSFPFYGSYHHNDTNKYIHILFVPVIFSTALRFANFVPIGNFRIPDAVTAALLQPTGKVLSLADVMAVLYAGSFIKMHPVAGVLYAPVLGLLHHFGTVTLDKSVPLAVALHLVGWISQFIGHGVFEKRKPALIDNLFQSLHAAVFFVWLELLFMLGWNPKLKNELEGLILVEMAKNKARQAPVKVD